MNSTSRIRIGPVHYVLMNGPSHYSRRRLLSAAAGAALAGVSIPAWTRARSRPRLADGVLRVAGSVYGVGTFDPALSRDLDTNFFNRQVHRGLLQFDESLTPTPAIAESFETIDDGRGYRFVIRPGLSFPSGKPVDAYAVATSMSRAMNPLAAGGDASMLAAPTYLGDIEGADDVLQGRLQRIPGIEVESERSLTISLVEPSGTFPMRLCSVPASIVDANEMRMIDGVSVGPPGLGPFEVVSIEQDQVVRLRPSTSWFGETPGAAGIELVSGVAASNPFNLFQSGSIDLIPSLPRQLASLVTDAAMDIDGELASVPMFSIGYIALGTAVPPLDDPHVRRAIVLAFPASRMASDAYQGQVEPPRGLIPQGMLRHDWPANVPKHDPEAARAELARSRYAAQGAFPPIEVFAADVELVEAFRDEIGRVLGIEVHLYDVAWSDFLAGLGRHDYNAYALYWGADYPDPESVLWMLFGAESADNYIGYANDRFEETLHTARTSVDDRDRIAGYAGAERILLDDSVCLPLYQDIGHALVRRGVEGVDMTPMGVMGLESVHIAEG